MTGQLMGFKKLRLAHCSGPSGVLTRLLNQVGVPEEQGSPWRSQLMRAMASINPLLLVFAS
eukprot:1158974-Pelagomonas_calceolata.AAC.4